MMACREIERRRFTMTAPSSARLFLLLLVVSSYYYLLSILNISSSLFLAQACYNYHQTAAFCILATAASVLPGATTFFTALAPLHAFYSPSQDGLRPTKHTRSIQSSSRQGRRLLAATKAPLDDTPSTKEDLIKKNGHQKTRTNVNRQPSENSPPHHHQQQQLDNPPTDLILTFSPTFHRYLVGRLSSSKNHRQGSSKNAHEHYPLASGSSIQILQSFLWLDEAQAYLQFLQHQEQQVKYDDSEKENHGREGTHRCDPPSRITKQAGFAATATTWSFPSLPHQPASSRINGTTATATTNCVDDDEQILQDLASLVVSFASLQQSSSSNSGRYLSSSSWSTANLGEPSTTNNSTTRVDDDPMTDDTAATTKATSGDLNTHHSTNHQGSNGISSNNNNQFLIDRIKEMLSSHVFDNSRWWVSPCAPKDANQPSGAFVSPHRRLSISSKRLIHHHQQVMDMLTRGHHGTKWTTTTTTSPSSSSLPPLLYPPGLAMDQATARQVLAKYPIVLLYDHMDWIQERINFLLAPLPPPGYRASTFRWYVIDENSNHIEPVPRRRGRPRRANILGHIQPQEEQVLDWALAYYQMGYGLGCTLEQATMAVTVLPQLLALNSLDASFGIVSVMFFYQQVPFEVMERVRLELQDDLIGASPSNVAMMAWLNHVAQWSMASCRALLQACSMIVLQCDTEPSWDVYENPKAMVRRQMKGFILEYLRHVLQLTPRHIKAMIKTHSRLSTYSLTKVQSVLQLLQQHGFSDADLQIIVMRMPSVLGVSIESGQRRFNFYYDEVGWTPQQMRRSLLKQPSLLHYSVESNLRPKLAFFRDELQLVNVTKLSKVLAKCPYILGRSLEQHLRYTAQAVTKRWLGDRNATESSPVNEKALMSSWGQMVQEAPELLELNWNSNLEPTLNFLTERLRLSPAQLLSLIKSTPRILTYSIDKSFTPKIALLESAVLSWGRNKAKSNSLEDVSVASLVLRNPSFLLTPVSTLERQLDRLTSDLVSGERERLLSPSNRSLFSVGPRARRVLEVNPSTGAAEAEFQSVAQAAAEIGVSNMYVYQMLRDERLWKNGNKFVYKNALETSSSPSIAALETPSNRSIFPLGRPARKVLEVNPSRGAVVAEFQSVAQAATEIGVTIPQFYQMVRNERLWKNGNKFVYKNALESSPSPSIAALKTPMATLDPLPPLGEFELRGNSTIGNIPGWAIDISKKMKVRPQQQLLFQEFAHIGLIEALHACQYPLPREGLANVLSLSGPATGGDLSAAEASPPPQLTIFVSGRAYPPDNMKQVRGQRRAGGLAIYLPQVYYYYWNNCPTGQGGFAVAVKLQQAATSCLEQTLYFDTGLETTTNFADGTILLAYPYLRPSRNRCSLYVCRDALRLVSELIRQDRKKDQHKEPLQVILYTDSSYAWKMLHNVTRLLLWGSHSTIESFLQTHGHRDDGSGLTNLDILYPLCRTYYRLVTDQNVIVSFRHVSETYRVDGPRDAKSIKMPLLAMQAAAIQYERVLKR